MLKKSDAVAKLEPGMVIGKERHPPLLHQFGFSEIVELELLVYGKELEAAVHESLVGA
jgi:hypothetical protein